MPQEPTRPHQLESLPSCDEVRVKDHGEAKRYVSMRDAVLKYMPEEPTVKALFVLWNKKTKMSKLATALAKANDRERDAACRRFIEGVLSLNRIIGSEIIQAVKKWGLPWSWVERGLLRAFVLQHIGTASGIPFRTWSEIQKDELNIKLTIPSGTSDGELEAALDRIRQAYQANLLPTGRAPKQPKPKEKSHLDQWAYWLVRSYVGRVEIAELAKELHETHHQTPDGPLNCQNDYATASKGIQEAHRLLSLTKYATKFPD